jgi:hypothetical protein
MKAHSVNLEVYFGLESGHQLSGVLINNLHILTLASNLYNRNAHRLANKINIYLGENKSQLLPKSVHIPKSYYTNNPLTDDFQKTLRVFRDIYTLIVTKTL